MNSERFSTGFYIGFAEIRLGNLLTNLHKPAAMDVHGNVQHKFSVSPILVEFCCTLLLTTAPYNDQLCIEHLLHQKVPTALTCSCGQNLKLKILNKQEELP